jgi:NAD(P)-dependent dehydrogenase (short-subunit alcohol dehydrogenase family)
MRSNRHRATASPADTPETLADVTPRLCPHNAGQQLTTTGASHVSGMTNLVGKVAVVTGGASGIGRGIAARLIAQGMQLVIADVEQTALDSTAAALGAIGIRTDVSSLESVEALAKEAQNRFGTVHVLCNNAGVGSVARLEKMTRADWQWMLGVNLWGVINGVSAFLPLLKANPEGGHIVNTASMGGLATLPNLGGYTTTKFAVVAFSETLAAELAEDQSRVGVTVLCPGPVRSNIKLSHRNRPASLPAGGLVDSDLEKTDEGAAMPWLDPEQVGDVVVRAIRRGDLYALTHPEMAALTTARHERIAAAFQAAAEDARSSPRV